MGFKEKHSEQFCQPQLTGLSGRRKSTHPHLARKTSLDTLMKPNQPTNKKKKETRWAFSRAQERSQAKNQRRFCCCLREQHTK